MNSDCEITMANPPIQRVLWGCQLIGPGTSEASCTAQSGLSGSGTDFHIDSLVLLFNRSHRPLIKISLCLTSPLWLDLCSVPSVLVAYQRLKRTWKTSNYSCSRIRLRLAKQVHPWLSWMSMSWHHTLRHRTQRSFRQTMPYFMAFVTRAPTQGYRLPKIPLQNRKGTSASHQPVRNQTPPHRGAEPRS